LYLSPDSATLQCHGCRCLSQMCRQSHAPNRATERLDCSTTGFSPLLAASRAIETHSDDRTVVTAALRLMQELANGLITQRQLTAGRQSIDGTSCARTIRVTEWTAAAEVVVEALCHFTTIGDPSEAWRTIMTMLQLDSTIDTVVPPMPITAACSTSGVFEALCCSIRSQDKDVVKLSVTTAATLLHSTKPCTQEDNRHDKASFTHVERMHSLHRRVMMAAVCAELPNALIDAALRCKSSLSDQKSSHSVQFQTSELRVCGLVGYATTKVPKAAQRDTEQGEDASALLSCCDSLLRFSGSSLPEATRSFCQAAAQLQHRLHLLEGQPLLAQCVLEGVPVAMLAHPEETTEPGIQALAAVAEMFPTMTRDVLRTRTLQVPVGMFCTRRVNAATIVAQRMWVARRCPHDAVGCQALRQAVQVGAPIHTFRLPDPSSGAPPSSDTVRLLPSGDLQLQRINPFGAEPILAGFQVGGDGSAKTGRDAVPLGAILCPFREGASKGDGCEAGGPAVLAMRVVPGCMSPAAS